MEGRDRSTEASSGYGFHLQVNSRQKEESHENYKAQESGARDVIDQYPNFPSILVKSRLPIGFRKRRGKCSPCRCAGLKASGQDLGPGVHCGC